MVLLLLSVVWSFIEPHILTVRRVTVAKADIPEALNGFRIVQLSDIHYGPFVSQRFLREAVEKTNTLDPDLVVITGDYVYGKGDPSPAFAILQGLRSRYGVLSVFGNHDYFADVAMLRTKLREAGIEDVEDRIETRFARGDLLKVVGMSVWWRSTYQVRPLLSYAQKDDFVILLLHNPDYLFRVPVGKVDLAFVGHTHGGQVTFFGLFAPLLPLVLKSGQTYRSGVIEQGSMTVVVSRGLGTIGLPVRFFAPPEIVLVTLEHKEQ